MSFQLMPFLDVFKDETGGNIKTPRREFLEEGEFPVVDQGQLLVAGFVNDRSRVCNVIPPVIVFGDHTRAIKYVDFEFAMGADGTKVLVPKIESDAKYLYYALKSLEIPSAGYSRHYRFLKETLIPLPPLAEQQRIAGILDAVDALRVKRREALAELDTLLKSTFLSMFGDPVTNPMGWEERTLGELAQWFRNGLSPSTKGTVDGEVLTLSAVTRGRFNFAAKKRARFDNSPSLSQTLSTDTFLICRGNGNRRLVGTGVYPDRSSGRVCFPDTMIGVAVSRSIIAPAYLQSVWRTRRVRRQIERGARTTNGIHKVNQRLLSSIKFPVPPTDLQLHFTAIVESVARQTARHRAHLTELDTLFASLQSRAFRGDL